MSALRFRHYLLPVTAVRAYALWALARKRGRELRLLQRRVAAARLGASWPRHAIQPSLYEDLR